ncbi:MAG: hydroxymethylbilane synthase [Defluviitaleaceae bacterium]|nr:hydroxymethylbilane synthase [Defluviitaleaceae bacterium]
MKKAILVVSFGVLNKASRDRTVTACESELADEFAEYDFFRAYTSEKIIGKIRAREGIVIDNPRQALTGIHRLGYDEVVVCPLYIIHGEEYGKLKNICESFRQAFGKITLADPLLASGEGIREVAQAIKSQLPEPRGNQAIVLVGHGTSGTAHPSYPALESALQDAGVNAFIGTLKESQSLEHVAGKLKRHNITSVILMSLLLAAGYHSSNEIGGSDRNSWKNRLETLGYGVTVNPASLGENPHIRKLFNRRIHRMLAQSDQNHNRLVIGTRGSNLALAQTRWVIERLTAAHPGVECEVRTIETKGDAVQHLPLGKIGGSGLFIREVEQQLLDRRIDVAVHSMKDLPSAMTPGLRLVSTPKREDPRDVLILRDGSASLDDLPHGARIGTGSARRKYQILTVRPDLEIIPIRGNIETRIRKIGEENLDGVVLAAAGVLRAGLSHMISSYLPLDVMIPAPAQGILAIQIRENDFETEDLLKPIKDGEACLQAAAERAFLEGIGGSCHIPVGAHCEVQSGKLRLTGLVGDAEGRKLVTNTIEKHFGKSPDQYDARELGLALANEVKRLMCEES